MWGRALLVWLFIPYDKIMTNKKIISVGLFGIAMAYLETAVVVYLRRMYGITDFSLGGPTFDPFVGAIEVGREFATLIMLLTVGWAAGKSLQDRIGYSLMIFGVWDIFYYIWLWVLIRWPKSFLETDLLFLIPLPWWGPVIAPMLIALLMVIGGISAVLLENKGCRIQFSAVDWVAIVLGIIILLYSFMRDAIKTLPADAETLSKLRPSAFNWWIYIPGLVLLGYGVMHVIGKSRLRNI